MIEFQAIIDENYEIAFARILEEPSYKGEFSKIIFMEGMAFCIGKALSKFQGGCALDYVFILNELDSLGELGSISVELGSVSEDSVEVKAPLIYGAFGRILFRYEKIPEGTERAEHFYFFLSGVYIFTLLKSNVLCAYPDNMKIVYLKNFLSYINRSSL